MTSSAPVLSAYNFVSCLFIILCILSHFAGSVLFWRKNSTFVRKSFSGSRVTDFSVITDGKMTLESVGIAVELINSQWDIVC